MASTLLRARGPRCGARSCTSEPEPFVAGEDDRLRAGPHAQLVEHARGVIADGLLADVQTLGDVEVAQPGVKPVGANRPRNDAAVPAGEADGYTLMFGCVSGPEWGAMGGTT